MKRLSFFLVLATLIVSFGLANAGQVTLVNVTGTWDDGGTDKIIPGFPVEWYIDFINDDGVKHGGFTTGFEMTVSSGTFTGLTGDTLPSGTSWADRFGLGSAIDVSGIDGTSPEVIGFSGAGLPSDAGFPDGDVLSVRLNSGGFEDGAVVCIDSSFFGAIGFWVWGTGFNPSWDGPHCMDVLDPGCIAPGISNLPASISGSHCDPMQYDFDGFAQDPLIADVFYAADIGSIDANGLWTYAPTLADVGASVNVTITMSNGVCSMDYVVPVNATNEAPVPDCSAAGGDISTGAATDFVITATDDCDPFTFSVGATLVNATATIDPSTGVVSVTPGGAGYYEVEVCVSDGNASSCCTFSGTAIAGSLFQVEIPCIGDQESNFVYQGQMVDVPVTLNNKEIGGFDLLIAYDNSALSFQSADPGADLLANSWEYFTYRYGADGNCSNACPSGLLRLVAIAETNNGPNHPTQAGVTDIATMTFLVTNDRTFECSEIPIRFFWLDCGDNSLSNWAGDELHISEAVFDGDPTLFPPNGNDIFDPTYGYPTYFGAQDVDCFTDPVKTPIRDVSFNNGCVFIACADSIDARADLNLNNVAYEIADAVLYSNYFVYGIGVFNINMEGQIAASDVNADGLSLSVADLVYLIRVIVGDAIPYAKLSPVVATVTNDNNVLSVDAEMGAALVVVKGNVTPTVLAENMDLLYAYDAVSNTTRALVFDVDGSTFSQNFINAGGEVVSVELGSAEGATVNAKVLPANFGLNQNYPNPFNPTTAISFNLPVASDVNLTIYNITGQKVTSFSGSYEAGTQVIEWDASNQASGIYFYKLNAGNFEATKKMVLMK